MQGILAQGLQVRRRGGQSLAGQGAGFLQLLFIIVLFTQATEHPGQIVVQMRVIGHIRLGFAVILQRNGVLPGSGGQIAQIEITFRHRDGRRRILALGSFGFAPCLVGLAQVQMLFGRQGIRQVVRPAGRAAKQQQGPYKTAQAVERYAHGKSSFLRRLKGSNNFGYDCSRHRSGRMPLPARPPARRRPRAGSPAGPAGRRRSCP